MPMPFSDTSVELSGAVQEIDSICGTDSNSFKLGTKARRVNAALKQFFMLAFEADGRFTFDDVSHGDTPIRTQNLVSGQQEYDLDDFFSGILNVLRFEVADSNGKFSKIERLNRTKIKVGLSEYKNSAGVPNEYDLYGNTVKLYPASSYNSTGGFRAYFNRGPVAFISTDTSKTLPVPEHFEMYICRVAALPYLIDKEKSRKNDIAALIAKDELAIKKFFSNREKGNEANGKLGTARRRFR